MNIKLDECLQQEGWIVLRELPPRVGSQESQSVTIYTDSRVTSLYGASGCALRYPSIAELPPCAGKGEHHRF